MSETLTKDYIETRLRAYDPDIDLSAGSPVQTLVVEPLVRKLQPDFMDMNVEAFIEARLKQEFPTMNYQEGSGIRDLLVKPATLLMDPLKRELTFLRQGQTLSSPDLLADDDVEALAANVFVTRPDAGLSTGTARLYFSAPVATDISIGNYVYDTDGLKFIPTSLQSISAETMSLNQSGSLFYFDVNVTAEKAGKAYNIAKNKLTGIANLTVAVKVDNLVKFSGGTNDLTTVELISQADTSVTERSLVTGRGVVARLQDQFSNVKHIQVVGYGEDDMLRDIITGGSYGELVGAGSDGRTDDDGDGDNYTDIFQSSWTDFSTLLGGVGAVESYYLIYSEVLTFNDARIDFVDLRNVVIPSVVFTTADVGGNLVLTSVNPANNGSQEIITYIGPNEVRINTTGVVETNMPYLYIRPPVEVEIEEVLTPNAIKVKTDTLPTPRGTMMWSIRRKEISLSDIPGGMLTGSGTPETLSVQPDEVHIGQNTDIYVKGTEVEEANVVLASIADEAPLVYALTMQTDSLTPEFVKDTTKDFYALGVLPGHSLVIESGNDKGTYQILQVGVDSAGAPNTSFLQINGTIGSTAANIRYRVIDDIDVNLRFPKTLRGVGTDLQTIQLSDTVTTTAGLDFASIGGVVGDTLEILNGDDKGKYGVLAISGTGNKNLELDSGMVGTAVGLGWELYNLQTGIDWPMIRIRDVKMLDSSKQPTGYTVPYAPAVDAVSTSFSNSGNGRKIDIQDAITGILGTVDLAGLVYPLAATTINVMVDGVGPTGINLGTSVDQYDILDRINAVFPQIADIYDVDGESRLAIRSLDRWIVITGAPDNANVGLDTTGEDNRQIKSTASVVDWLTYGIDTKDAVWIQTGDSIGFYSVLRVEPDRIFVTRVDTDGRARFMLPGYGVSVRVGARSYGNARVYFLAPTSAEFRGDWRGAAKKSFSYPANVSVLEPPGTIPEDELPVAYFTTVVGGTSLRFFPDPDLKHQVYPVGSNDVPNNLTTDGTDVVTSTATVAGPLGKNSRDPAVDFLTQEILAGDLVDVTYQPIQGDSDLALLTLGTNPATNELFNKTLIISADGVKKTIVFDEQASDVDKVAEKINAGVGATVAYIETIGATKFIRFEADFSLTVHKDSTAIYQAAPPNALLWNAALVSNATNVAVADIDGYYRVFNVAPTPSTHGELQLLDPDGSPSTPSAGESQHFTVYRPGVQRFGTTTMSTQTESGLYYVDVELVSEGPGNEWNLDADLQMSIVGYRSDGYSLIPNDNNLTYSVEETTYMTLSRRIIPVGAIDSPTSAVQLHSTNIQIDYDRSSIVEAVQSFARSKLEKVLCASILVRHLTPHYLNFDLLYRGGSADKVVLEDVEDYLDELGPEDRVEVSDLAALATKRGANYIVNPMELVSVVHNYKRIVEVVRSKDAVSKNLRAAFFTGELNVSKEEVDPL